MKTDKMILAFAYLRLSREESLGSSESSSITNQRMIISDFCKRNGILLVREFVDDGWSGGNFDRPAFTEMLKQLEQGHANAVITKDLSRLGRDMTEASRYAEQYLPERGIRYITVSDSFDSSEDNVLAPFQFAMNEVYLRDGSRKIKEVLKNKRENGQYCACPPYGYKKDPTDKYHLVPDEITAPTVKRIFEAAASGDSSRKIALDLSDDKVLPPLKYRVLYRGEFSDVGAARASDLWNYTTVKRILKNPVYLGHTLLGKTRKVSVKSKKKVKVDKDEWCVTENTHEPLVTEALFEKAQMNMGKGTKKYEGFDNIRKSIFSGIAYCKKCGHALCSCGTVYKGEREKYWYLGCINQRPDITNPCSGARIRYKDLTELIRNDLNELLALSDTEMKNLAEELIERNNMAASIGNPELQKQKLEARLDTIGKIITKLYTDNAEGKLSDDRLYSMVAEHEKEAASIKNTLTELSVVDTADKTRADFKRFYEAAKKYTHIDVLDRETLLAFVDRIEVGEKILPAGTKMVTHRNQPYTQEINIYYKFIGNISETEQRDVV